MYLVDVDVFGLQAPKRIVELLLNARRRCVAMYVSMFVPLEPDLGGNDGVLSSPL